MMKSSKKLTKIIQQYRAVFLLLFVLLLILVSYIKTPPQKYNNDIPGDVNPKTSPAVNYKVLSFDIPSDWKTYTTNSLMDSHPNALKKITDSEIPTLSFGYPDIWHVQTLTKSSTLDTQFPLTIGIRKTHPKNGNIHQQEGLLPDNASFDMYLGITPKGIENFDKNFWGFGHLHTRTDYYLVNGVPLVLGYYASDFEKEKLVGALFKITPTMQLRLQTTFENTDSQCATEYCIDTTNEMLQILSTFKFTK